MTLALAAVQVLLLVNGQFQATGTAALTGSLVTTAGGVCLEGDVAPCTKVGCSTGEKTCTAMGTWGACVCQQVSCPSTACKTGSPVFANGAWGCSYTNAQPGASCDTDGDLCNGEDKCNAAGTCVAASPPGVDDGNPATLDFCGPEGEKHVQIVSNGTATEASATPMPGPDPRSRALPVAPNAGGPVVDESRGTLNYRYSFELPAARGRYQPRLELTYSSASTYNDSSGAGWRLTSFYIEADTAAPPTPGPAVTRPSQWWLVLDGARTRLLPKPNAPGEWRTEVQGPFVSVKRLADGTWEAVDSVGTIFRFNQGFPGTFLPGSTTDKYLGRWYLGQVSDVDNNTTMFTYQAETGASALMTGITYNFFSGISHPDTTVELAWSPDYQSRFQRAADTVALRSNVLRTVRIKGASTVGSPTLLRHELTYAHQQQADTLLLTQIVVKAGETETALPPTTFDYQQGTTNYQLGAGAVLAGLEQYLTTSPWNQQWLDLDGDGLPDLVEWPMWRRNTTAPGEVTPTFAASVRIPGSESLPVDLSFAGNPLQAALMDVNGDGLIDLVTVGRHFDRVSLVWLSDPGYHSDYEVRLGQGTGASYSLSTTVLFVFATDFHLQVASTPFDHFGIRYERSTVDDHALMDMNGDGIVDLVKPDATDSGLMDVWLGVPARDTAGSLVGLAFSNLKTPAAASPIAAISGLDLNGDGLVGDVAAIYGLMTSSPVTFAEGGSFRDTGASWAIRRWAVGATPSMIALERPAVLPVALDQFVWEVPPLDEVVAVEFEDPRATMALADLNGDGRPDLLVKPRADDPACNSARWCQPGESITGLCYHTAMACPLNIYWNTGGGFELGGSVSAQPCAGDVACPSDLLPFARYRAPENNAATCHRWMSGSNASYAASCTTTFNGWSAGFIDLNGDGVADYATNQGGVWTYFGGSNTAPLLNKVTTAAGAAYTATYGAGASYGAGPLDGARDVVTQVKLSGPGISNSTTGYKYAFPIHGPNPANFNRIEPRGFSESWSWLAEQTTSEMVAKHVRWNTSSAVLAGAPTKVEWGTFTGTEPGNAGLSAFKRTEFDYLVKSLDTGTCAPSSSELSASAYPVIPITSLERNLDNVGSTIWLGSERSRGCSDIDGVGNVLNTTIKANGTWNSTGNSFVASNTLVESSTFDAGAECRSCPTENVLKDGGGVVVAATKYFYDSPAGSWKLPVAGAGKGHLNYVKRWVSNSPAVRWDTASAIAYNGDGTVQYQVSDPWPGGHALSTTETYTYDANRLRVRMTTRTDGVQTLFTSATYDIYGRLESQRGPYLASGEAAAPTQAFARDAFGRVVAVGRSTSFNATTGATTVTGAMAATEYQDTSPPVVRSYTFLAPRTFVAGAVPATPDVKQVVAFKDELGRTIEVRERLGVAGTPDPSSQVIQALTGYRVVSLVKYDAAGRVVASLEPTTAADGVTPSNFDSVALGASLRGAKTVYDATGRVTCSKAGVFAALGGDASCTTSKESGAGYHVATAYTYGSAEGALQARLATVTAWAPGRISGTGTDTTIGTTTTFRADGRVQDIVDQPSNTVTTSYDLLGRALAVTRKSAGLSAVATSTRTLDGLGRVAEEWDDNWSPGQSPSRIYTYDQVGRAYSIKLPSPTPGVEANRPEVKYEFKSLGRLTKVSVTEPGSAARQLAALAYDAPYTGNGALYANTAGRLASVVGPGTSIAFGYDQNGQAIRRDQWIAGLTGAFSLTGIISDDGRMLAGSLFSGYSKAVNYFGRYDSAGRPVRVDAGGASAGAAPVVNLWEVRNAANTNYDGYDVLGRVGRLRSNGGTVDTYRNYDAYTGALSSQVASLASGIKAYGIDSVVYFGSKLTSYRDTTVPGTVTSYGYTYDDAGRLATAKASRVGPAAISQGYGESYSARRARDPAWPSAGASMENLEQVSDVSGITDYTYEGDRATQLSDPSGAVKATLSYDHAGRATSRTAGAVVEGFTHDTLDRLVKVTRSGQVDELLEYAPTGDPLFRKLGTKGTWYVGSVATVTADVPALCEQLPKFTNDPDGCYAVAGTVKVAAHVQVAGGRVASVKAAAGSGLDPVSEVLYYHRDMQGSVVATTYRTGGYNGYLGARYRYTPYGQLDRAENVSPSSDSELGYTGGLRLGYTAGAAQQGNLVLLGARVYHAELKRWLVPDTVDGRRYTYTGGDPVNFVDPSGRAAIVGGGGGGDVEAGGIGGSLGYGGIQLRPAPPGTPDCRDDMPIGTKCRMPNGDEATVVGHGGGKSPPGNTRPPPPGAETIGPGERGGGGGGGTSSDGKNLKAAAYPLKYIDVGFSVGRVYGITAGVILDTENLTLRLYAGPALTAGYAATFTMSGDSVTEGWNIAVQYARPGNSGIGGIGQVGLDPNGYRFTEFGFGYGQGWSVSGIWISPPISTPASKWDPFKW